MVVQPYLGLGRLGFSTSFQHPGSLWLAGRAKLATHHAYFCRYEIAQSVEPLHVGLYVVSLVTEAGLEKTYSLSLLVGKILEFRIRSQSS